MLMFVNNNKNCGRFELNGMTVLEESRRQKSERTSVVWYMYISSVVT
jgi:hypothetical protein